MLTNKDTLIRIFIGFIFFIIFAKMISPFLYHLFTKNFFLKKKVDDDLDYMIKKQTERLKASYGQGSFLESAQNKTESKNDKMKWGLGEFSKEIQLEIAKHYSYNFSESKINSFLLLSEKRNFLQYLNHSGDIVDHKVIVNYLTIVVLNLTLIDEIKKKSFLFLNQVAKKCNTDVPRFIIAYQMKIFFLSGETDERKLFSTTSFLHLYSEEKIKTIFILLLQKEASLWAKGHSAFFEEFSLYISYAEIVMQLPKLKDKKDLKTAYLILNINEHMSLEEIKKAYKKIAMNKHPDKIGQMKLPKILEKKALENFNYIQEAYELILTARTK